MSKNVITVDPGTSLEEAAAKMSEHSISGLPVVEDDGKLVGIISEKDLIYKDKKLHFPDYINLIGGIIYLESFRKFEKEFKKYIAIKVEELMTKEVVSINENTKVDEIANIMVEKDVNRVPVLREGKLLGIVTRADLVKDIARGKGD